MSYKEALDYFKGMITTNTADANAASAAAALPTGAATGKSP